MDECTCAIMEGPPRQAFVGTPRSLVRTRGGYLMIADKISSDGFDSQIDLFHRDSENASMKSMLVSSVCKYADFSAPWYRSQELSLMIRKMYAGHSAQQFDFVNRKFWEWCAIAQALDERRMLRSGISGLGFAVGREPLASHFAARGCDILATDLEAENSEGNWISTDQHASSLEALFQPLLVQREVFEARVAFKPADMRTLKGLTGEHDFIWSSCALEHLGTLQAGIDFVVESSKLLRPGGVAVHTTEFNVASELATVEAGGNVIYRRSDILALAAQLRLLGLHLVTPDFDAGNHRYDLEFDTPPYMESGKVHLKLEIDGFVSTSMLLIVERAA